MVLDVRLPGISGLDLQHELRSEGIKVPIIFITGHADVPMTVRAMKSGAVEFLTKPFRDQDLLDVIHCALNRDRLALFQVGRFSFFKNEVYRGSPCKLFSRGSTFVKIKPLSRWV